jgi:hypothetical protein
MVGENRREILKTGAVVSYEYLQPICKNDRITRLLLWEVLKTSTVINGYFNPSAKNDRILTAHL